jgi:hypothetical protein
VTPPIALRRSPITAFAGALLACAVLAGSVRERVGRHEVERFVVETGLAARRPLDAASIALEPEADLAAAAAVSVALHDSGGVSDSSGPAARRLAAGALAARPGWPLHAEILAEAAYRESRGRAMRSAAAASGWLAAWRAATTGAPGVRLFRARLGEACLQAWSTLPGDLRPRALDAIRSAMADPEFVTAHVAEAADAAGLERALGLLPPRADPLRAAAAALAGRSLEAAKGLLDRADSAAEAERSTALRRLETLAHGSRARERADACRAFAEEFPVDRLADRPRADQAARLLALWPDEPGDWETDARAELVRSLLELGGAAGVDTHTGIWAGARRAVESLAGAPPAVVASILDATGDPASAEKMRTSSTGATAAADWTPYDLRRARRALSRGDVSEAQKALERVPPARRGECGALIVRRELALRSGDTTGASNAETLLAAFDAERAASWRSSGRLRMCVDASQPLRTVQVSVEAAAPAIVVYGWDRSEAGSRLVSGAASWDVPLPDGGGDREIWLATLAGGPATPSAASPH